MDLLIAGKRVRRAQIGPDCCVFDHPILLPATTGDGEIVLLIDGHSHRWKVAIKPCSVASRIIEATFTDAA